MKTKLFLLIAVAAVVCACEEQIGKASLIEGAWDLQKAEYGQIVSADLTGQTHLKDEPYTHVYESKEQTWLFWDNHIGGSISRTKKTLSGLLGSVTVAHPIPSRAKENN